MHILLKPLTKLGPHLDFNEFHISFKNLSKMFREIHSRARAEFLVCLSLNVLAATIISLVGYC